MHTSSVTLPTFWTRIKAPERQKKTLTNGLKSVDLSSNCDYMSVLSSRLFLLPPGGQNLSHFRNKQREFNTSSYLDANKEAEKAKESSKK